MLAKSLLKISGILLTAIITSFTYSVTSFADDDSNRKLPRPPVESSGTMIINWSLLNLTPTQTQRIRLLRLDFQKLSIKLKAEIDIKQLDIEKLLVSPSSDNSEIRKLLKEKLSTETKLKMEALDNFLVIKSLLTPDQLSRLPKAVNMK